MLYATLKEILVDSSAANAPNFSSTSSYSFKILSTQALKTSNLNILSSNKGSVDDGFFFSSNPSVP